MATVTQRLLAAALITVQLAVVGYCTGTAALPVLLAAAAWFGALRSRPVLVSRRWLFYLALLVCLIAAVHHWATPYRFQLSTRMANSALSYSLGLAAILFQLLPLFVRLAPPADPPPSSCLEGQVRLGGSEASDPLRRVASQRLRPLPLWLPLAGILALICFGDVRLDYMTRWVFQAAVVLFALLAGLYCGSCRRYVGQDAAKRSTVHLTATLVVLGLVGTAAWTLTTAVYLYEPEISRLMFRLAQSWFMERLTGFSGVAGLQSLTARKQSRQIVLRVQSAEPPGYLRGKVFDSLTESRWQMRAQTQMPISLYVPAKVREELAVPPKLLGFLQYGLSEPRSVDWYSFDACWIWQDASLAGRFFTPAGTQVLLTADEYLQVDEHGIFCAVGRCPELPYVALARSDLPRQSLPDSLRHLLLQVPADLDPRIRGLSEKVFANCRTDEEKIRAVVDFFRREFRYSLNVRVPNGVDPITYFLLARPPAHCEFFATGAALLLRLANVPCRYVCGFVVHERNPLGGYWVVRNCDAHAWVEAFVDGEGWVVVDPTPPEGIPSDSKTYLAAVGHVIDFIRWRLWQLRLQGQRNEFRSLGELIGAFVRGIPLWPIVALAFAASLGLTLCRRTRQGRSRGPAAADVPPTLVRLLAKADRLARRRNLVRQPAETLDRFAERVGQRPGLRQLAEWYRLYATLRYRGQWNDGQLELLRDRLSQCQLSYRTGHRGRRPTKMPAGRRSQT